MVGCIIPAGHNVQDFKHSSPNWQRFMRKVKRDDWPGLSTGYGEQSARVYCIHSDNNGETWRYGGLAPYGEGTRSVNETQFVELRDGSILLNGRGGGRAIAKSDDGGETRSTMQLEPALTGPECAARLLRYSFSSESGQTSEPGRKSRILFSLLSSSGRKHGKIWLSYDEGKSWPVQRNLRPGFFVYSCLTRLPDGDIGCVYGSRGKPPARDKLGPRNVAFASFSLEWLTNRADVAQPLKQ